MSMELTFVDRPLTVREMILVGQVAQLAAGMTAAPAALEAMVRPVHARAIDSPGIESLLDLPTADLAELCNRMMASVPNPTVTPGPVSAIDQAIEQIARQRWQEKA